MLRLASRQPGDAFKERQQMPATVIEGANLHPVVTDDFILVPNPRVCDPAQPYRVTFTAKRRP